MSALSLILAALFWGLVHSLLASTDVKDLVRRWLGSGIMRYYRLAYNVFSLASILPVLALIAILPARRLYVIPPPWLFFTLIGQALAIIILLFGILQTGVLEFLGLRQLIIPLDDRSSKLIMGGLYHWVRHPLYSGGLLFIWLSPVMTDSLLVLFISLTIYILVGAHFEERKLLREFGESYGEYLATTPMLIPGLRLGIGQKPKPRSRKPAKRA